ncbi:GSCOCT00013843001.3-RA-CDS [Cotesia congregata]|uniref:Gustatory receptor n=1 Tax=Cotesia congregata TaxID=51543 RepID=A0A8J2HA42_COTCN|nr:GSCOCT00013843001.3-RA-CDS [Cotesia congregata]CAG5083856.1 gustatory receptor 34.1 [Cotesia congregata]
MEQTFSSRNYNSNFSWQNRALIIIQYIFFKTIGLSPWALNLAQIVKKRRGRNFSNQPITITKSVYGSLYNIILILFIIIYNILFFLHEFANSQNELQLTVTVKISLRISGAMTTIVVWISYILRQKLIVQTVKKFANVDRILAKCCYKTNQPINDNYIKLAVLSHFILSFVGFIVMLKVYPIAVVPFRYVPAIINSWVMTQYSLILNMIINRLKIINTRILKLGNVETSIKPRVVLADRSPLTDPKLVAFDLRHISNAHSQLSELPSEVSNFFGFPILLVIFYSGVSGTVYSYFVIFSFFEKFKQENIINYFSVGLWYSYMILSFILMTTNVTRIKVQSKQTADAIHLVLDRCLMDQKIEDQVNMIFFILASCTQKVNYNYK